SFVMPQYSPEGSITAIISREITPDEHEKFNLSVQYADFGDYVPGIAYSMQCVESSLSVSGPATITMGVSHEWVRQYSGYTDIHDRFRVHQMNPDGSFKSLNMVFSSHNSTDNRDYYKLTSDDGIDLARLYVLTVGNLTESEARITLISVTGPAHSNPTEIVLGVDSDWLASNNIGGLADVYEPVKIIRVDDQGNIEILTTKFLYFDESRGIDIFQAISPNGFSKFTLVTVAHYTNPLQMLYLSVSTRVTPPVPSGNPAASAGGGGGGGSYGGNGNQALSVQEPDTAKGTQPGDIQEEVSAASLSKNGQSSGSQLQESVSSVQGSADPVPRESYIPAVNPPVVPPQPTNSIFTMLIEAAAIVSIFVLVVFSVYMRNRKSE
ncbi:MAG: hypothetical protein MUF37_02925, partial [Methanoregulaceae archaeon]|nr:hypothetical protein [Methanoregulaceae archaeon]